MAANVSALHRLPNGLTTQQFKFLTVFAVIGNVKEAAALAGYKSVNACYQLLQKPHVQDVLQDLIDGKVATSEYAYLKRQLIEELKAIAFSDVRTYFQTATVKDENGEELLTYIPSEPEKWTQEAAAAVSRIKWHPANKGGGMAEIALWNKLDAMKTLNALTIPEADPLVEEKPAGRQPPKIRSFLAQDVESEE